MKIEVGIDLGYSSAKISSNGELYKLPTAISFAMDTGITYGESNVVDFEGEQLYIGDVALSNESFTTTDYKFKYKYDPVIIYYALFKLDLLERAEAGEVTLSLGLALVDWKNKDEYLERIKSFEVNGKKYIFNDIKLIPQGAGAYIGFIAKGNPHPDKCSLIDIGYNTINFLYFRNGTPQRSHSKSFPGHGVSSIIRPLTNFMESTFDIKMSEQEVLETFQKGTFKFYGEDQPQVEKIIYELQFQFVKKLFNSILVSEKKLLSTSDTVLLSGGGCYLLENAKFRENYKFVDSPYEFSNVLGSVL